MKRRHALALTLGLAAKSGGSRAQPRERRVGLLSSNLRPSEAALATHPLLKGLAQYGYVAGRNLAVDWRFAAGQFEALPDLVA